MNNKKRMILGFQTRSVQHNMMSIASSVIHTCLFALGNKLVLNN